MEGALWCVSRERYYSSAEKRKSGDERSEGCKAIDLTIWKTYLRWWSLYRGHIRCGQAAKSYLENAR